jgi:pilus assembly protein CpaB
MSRRILAIIIAVVLAGVGTAGVLFYALTADKRARDRLADKVHVLVAAQPIIAGTTTAKLRDAKSGLVRTETMPKSSLPKDYLSELTEDDDDLVAMFSVTAGQILRRSMFGEPGTFNAGLALPSDRMAVTVQTGVPEQVAGYVRAGAEVCVFVTYEVKDAKGEPTGITRTRMLLTRVQVLAVGTYQPPRGSTSSTPSTSSSTGDTATVRSGSLLVTLAVKQDEAERLIHGQSNGELYLGLLSDSTVVREGSGVDNRDAGPGTVPLFP